MHAIRWNGNKLKAAKKHSRKGQAARWLRGDDSFWWKAEEVRNYTWDEFVKYRRQYKVSFNDRDLRMWAMDKATEQNFKDLTYS